MTPAPEGRRESVIFDRVLEAVARVPYAHAADLEPIDSTVEPAAVGAAVTTALCGHWEHDGPCRWPNNHLTAPTSESWKYRVLFVAPVPEEAEARRRIE